MLYFPLVPLQLSWVRSGQWRRLCVLAPFLTLVRQRKSLGTLPSLEKEPMAVLLVSSFGTNHLVSTPIPEVGTVGAAELADSG